MRLILSEFPSMIMFIMPEEEIRLVRPGQIGLIKFFYASAVNVNKIDILQSISSEQPG